MPSPSSLAGLVLASWPLIHPASYRAAQDEIHGFIHNRDSIIEGLPNRIGDTYIVGLDKTKINTALSIYEKSGATSIIKVIGSTLITRDYLPTEIVGDVMAYGTGQLHLYGANSPVISENKIDDFFCGRTVIKKKHENIIVKQGAVHAYTFSSDILEVPGVRGFSRSYVASDFVRKISKAYVLRVPNVRKDKSYLNISVAEGDLLVIAGRGLALKYDYSCAGAQYLINKDVIGDEIESISNKIKEHGASKILNEVIEPNYLFDNVSIYSAVQGHDRDGSSGSGEIVHKNSGSRNFSLVSGDDTTYCFVVRRDERRGDLL